MKRHWLVLVIVGLASAAAIQTWGQPTTQSVESRAREARMRRAAGSQRPATRPTTTPSKLVWRGLDLSAAPVAVGGSTLPDIWEERPAGSRSYEVRADVTVIPANEWMVAAEIYWLRPANRFYVQYDSADSSIHHFYGPFQGDPNQVLAPATSQPAGK